MTQDISIREQWFKIAVFAFKEFDNNMLQEFYDYWSEPTRNGKKMKCELEKTWDMKKRLVRWKSNNEKWNKNAKKQPDIRSEVQAELMRRFN